MVYFLVVDASSPFGIFIVETSLWRGGWVLAWVQGRIFRGAEAPHSNHGQCAVEMGRLAVTLLRARRSRKESRFAGADTTQRMSVCGGRVLRGSSGQEATESHAYLSLYIYIYMYASLMFNIIQPKGKDRENRKWNPPR